MHLGRVAERLRRAVGHAGGYVRLCSKPNCRNPRHELWHLCAEHLGIWSKCTKIYIETGINPVTGEVSESKPEKPMRPKGSGPSDHKEVPFAEQVVVPAIGLSA